jgi:chemotaxis protein MotC
VLACATLLPARAEEAKPQPFELVRSLRTLQDLAATGNTSAPVEQRKLILQIAEQLLTADPQVWSDPKNVRAAVMYVLCGGEPRVLRALFSLRTLPGVEEKLLNGALAYGEGRNGDAAELLSTIDPRSLDPALGAQVALVRAALIGAKDAKRAEALLNDARIMAPGTLIEEAALRREVYVVASLDNREAFELLASQYVRRFANSVYASNFRQQFAAATVKFDYGGDAVRQTKLTTLIGDMEPGNQLAFYLSIAHEAVTKGKVDLAALAAQRAAALSAADTPEYERAHLYQAATLVASVEHDKGMILLKNLVRARLDDRDAELADAALAVGVEVGRLPSEASAEPATQASAGSDKANEQAVQSPALKGALSAIARVDELLNEGKK